MQKILIKLIDSFYFIFSRFMPLKTFRYAVCGGGNLVFDLLLYFLFYHYIFHKEDVDLHFFVLSSHIASLFFVFPITFFTGFLLNKYITFQDSNIPGKVQFVRYLMVALGAIGLSYLCMKLFVDVMKFYPTPSRIASALSLGVASYYVHKLFTFKIKE